MGGRMDERMDEWMDGCMMDDEWMMNGWMGV